MEVHLFGCCAVLFLFFTSSVQLFLKKSKLANRTAKLRATTNVIVFKF